MGHRSTAYIVAFILSFTVFHMDQLVYDFSMMVFSLSIHNFGVFGVQVSLEFSSIT